MSHCWVKASVFHYLYYQIKIPRTGFSVQRLDTITAVKKTSDLWCYLPERDFAAGPLDMDIPCELKVPGLHSRYRLEKCTRTLSRSWVSPLSANRERKVRSDASSVSPAKSKCRTYSSATARENSLLRMSGLVWHESWHVLRWNKINGIWVLYFACGFTVRKRK